MLKEVEQVCAALDSLSSATLSASNSDQTLSDQWGWNFPTVTRQDIASAASRLSKEIRDASIDSLDPETLKSVSDMPRRIHHLQGQVVPYLFNGHGNQAYTPYMAALQSIRLALAPHLEWQRVTDNKTMPAAIARRLKYLQNAIDQINPDRQSLESQIREIQEAHSVAESLPVDLQSLAEARERITRIAAETSTAASAASTAKTMCEEQLSQMRAAAKAAEKLKAQCEEAFRITTTKGLSAAFDQRAKRLAYSMWAWVGGLALSLAAAVYLGSERVELLNAALTTAPIVWGAIWMQLLLSLADVPPILSSAAIWSPIPQTKEVGREEAFLGRADHRVSA